MKENKEVKNQTGKEGTENHINAKIEHTCAHDYPIQKLQNTDQPKPMIL